MTDRILEFLRNHGEDGPCLVLDRNVKYFRKSWVSPKLFVAASNINGLGVVISEPLERHEVVIIWGGQVFTVEEVRAGKGRRHTLVGISDDLFIGNKTDEAPGVDDFMNHNCDPNVGMRDEVTLVAMRDVRKGEELCADYSIWLNDQTYRMNCLCNCQSSRCRGVIRPLA